MKKTMLFMMLVIVLLASCTKSREELSKPVKEKVYFRIQEVSTTGTETLSEVRLGLVY